MNFSYNRISTFTITYEMYLCSNKFFGFLYKKKILFFPFIDMKFFYKTLCKHSNKHFQRNWSNFSNIHIFWKKFFYFTHCAVVATYLSKRARKQWPGLVSCQQAHTHLSTELPKQGRQISWSCFELRGTEVSRIAFNGNSPNKF